MPLSPQEVYQQNIDRQRIVMTGERSGTLFQIIVEVLKFNKRNFNAVVDGTPSARVESPIVLIKDTNTAALLGYHHHVALLTAPQAKDLLPALQTFADATPKGGIVMYPEIDAALKSIGAKERADVQSIPYKITPYETKNGQTYLISSTNEKFAIHLTGNEALELLAAAKEILKKIGISSGQFYRAVENIKSL
jgi:UDP-N-acetylmuramate: L-alanyl-gamma-D-glutamyl-meso-diaminopimelate ligase